MTKIQNITTIALFLSSLLLFSCTDEQAEYEKQTELELVDSLEIDLAKTRVWLEISLPEIQGRIAPMEENIQTFNNLFEGEWTEELTINLDRYRGYLKIYKKFVRHYKPIVLETEELITQVKTLKKAVKQDKYKGKKEEFKTHYNQEKKDIKNNLLFAERYLRPVKIMERDYQRRADFVEKLISEL